MVDESKHPGPHCFEPGPRDDDGVGTTCMKPDGHDGPHEFVRDNEIFLRFRDDEPELSKD
jgi:hypothetical protein